MSLTLIPSTESTASFFSWTPYLADACVVVAIIAIILVFLWTKRRGDVSYVRSAVDGRQYLCLKLPDRQRAADMLGRVNERLQTLVDHMSTTYGRGYVCDRNDSTKGKSDDDDDDVHHHVVCIDSADVRRLVSNYNPDAVSEGGDQKGYTSYSVNKGERMVICVRNADASRSFVELNTVMYVAIHELGHLMTSDVGHTPTFWHNFKQLLDQAIAIGIYTRVDYAASPQPYCGITISSTVIKA